MDIIEAIQQRHSVRAFKPDPVPQSVLKELVALALRAPSWANVQPWKLVVASGQKLEDIKQGFLQKADEPVSTDVPLPLGFPEPYVSRQRANGARIMEINKISREDRERRKWWRLQGLQLFGAPCAIYICTDRAIYLQGDKLNVWPLFDCGMLAQNIMLLAVSRGLGTMPTIQSVLYPEVLRKVLGIPDSELIVLGITIGYPRAEEPVNLFRSERESVDTIARWYGFES